MYNLTTVLDHRCMNGVRSLMQHFVPSGKYEEADKEHWSSATVGPSGTEENRETGKSMGSNPGATVTSAPRDADIGTSMSVGNMT